MNQSLKFVTVASKKYSVDKLLAMVSVFPAMKMKKADLVDTEPLIVSSDLAEPIVANHEGKAYVLIATKNYSSWAGDEISCRLATKYALKSALADAQWENTRHIPVELRKKRAYSPGKPSSDQFTRNYVDQSPRKI